MYSTLFLCFTFLQIACNHRDNCLDSAKDYGTTNLYDTTLKIFDYYKDKKQLILKNENGDTLVFQIRYKTIIFNDTVANTLNGNKICTAEVAHYGYKNLELLRKDSNVYIFYLKPVTDFDYVLKKVNKKHDNISAGWEKGTPEELYNLHTFMYNPTTSKIPHKTVIIHGKNVEVIDPVEKKTTPEQVFIHEDKGIVAMIIPNHGTDYWVVDKIE